MLSGNSANTWCLRKWSWLINVNAVIWCFFPLLAPETGLVGTSEWREPIPQRNRLHSAGEVAQQTLSELFTQFFIKTHSVNHKMLRCWAAIHFTFCLHFFFFCRQTPTMSSQDLPIISLASNIMLERWVVESWGAFMSTSCITNRFQSKILILCFNRSCMMSKESWRRTETRSETTS